MTTTTIPPDATAFPTRLPGAVADTLMWADPADVEDAALAQLRTISRLPWVHGLRVMPDVHLGKGATVGSVVAMRDAVSPAAVGVDIGCGMTAVRTDLTTEDLPEDLRGLRHEIERAVPVGFHAHDVAPDVDRLGLGGAGAGWDTFWAGFGDLHETVRDRESKAMKQMGSLGGGNHFIEVTSDDGGRVWLMLHSGSRNIGKELAERHIAAAKGLDHNLDLPDRDLAVFLAGTAPMQAYLRDLYWAQDYAARNRAVMMALVREVVTTYFGARGRDVAYDRAISCHHNYVAQERYDDVDLVVTQQGRHPRGYGRLRPDPGIDGHRFVRRAGARQRAVLLLGVARCGTPDVAHPGPQDVHGGRPGRPDRGRRVPQGPRRGRRDPGGVQGPRVRHRGADRPRVGRGAAHHPALRQGLTAVG
jgi:tRNA-splicing ligase RtcB